MKLLTLSLVLDSNDTYKYFKIDDIYSLAQKYYPLNFFEQEKNNLRYQLMYFEFDVLNDMTLQNVFYCIIMSRIGKDRKLILLID
jgi:hypothetical protein